MEQRQKCFVALKSYNRFFSLSCVPICLLQGIPQCMCELCVLGRLTMALHCLTKCHLSLFSAYVSCDNTISVCITVPPTAPVNVTATVLSATSVSLTWSHPSSDGGVDITNYIITYRSSAEDQMTVETNSVSLTIELFDLTPYTAYEFLASAENAIGTGPASVTVQAMTLVGGKCTIIQ